MPRKIGIVGGLGWRATADYYSALHELGPEWPTQVGAAFETTVESLDISVARALLLDGEREGRWDGFDKYHRSALIRLMRSEAEIAIIACNTPHERLPQIVEGIGMKVIDLFEAVCAKAATDGARRLLILGTPMTMGSRRLRRLLGAYGIEPLSPPPGVDKQIEELIGDLEGGPVANAWPRLVTIVESCLGVARATDLVGLHCTELPLALPEGRRSSTFELGGIWFLNASMVHVEAALNAAG